MHKKKCSKRNIKMIMMYDGSRYKGFQRLLGENENSTIQGLIEECLGELLEERTRIIGSGRTDSGVHAYGQVANFYTNNRMECESIKTKLNQLLPNDIVVFQIEEVLSSFHSRYDAKEKTYEYHIDTRREACVFKRKYALHYPTFLDINKMNEAAKELIGEHDFSAFSSRMSDSRTTIRTIYELDIKKDQDEVRILIKGNGFLYNMVRIIVGTLLLVGKGEVKPSQIRQILESGNRENAGPTISSHGLFLKSVEY